ncbi:MAG: lipopolysaccharide transport periplasmic protein LptA [Burkholderiales bacterium]
MRTTAPRRTAALLATLLAAALWAPAAARGERADREKEIQVLADRLTADDAKKEAVYEGNVVVTQGTMRITSARILVREDPQGYRTYIATGSPVTFRQKREKEDDWIQGKAERAEFDDRNDLLKLYNGATLTSSQGELSGDYISYDRGKDFFQVTGAAPGAAPGEGSRVKATIIPQKRGADGKPAAAPAAPPVTLRPDAAGAGGKP